MCFKIQQKKKHNWGKVKETAKHFLLFSLRSGELQSEYKKVVKREITLNKPVVHVPTSWSRSMKAYCVIWRYYKWLVNVLANHNISFFHFYANIAYYFR